MTEPVKAASPSKAAKITGVVLGVIPCLLLTASGVMKIVQPGPFAEEYTKMGYPISTAVPIGITELVCTVLYLVPRTCVLGAILLTAYMGGAVATHVRVGDLFVVQVLIGVVIWLGLYLRDPRIRALAPFRSPVTK